MGITAAVDADKEMQMRKWLTLPQQPPRWR
jgi:hypothetical protein